MPALTTSDYYDGWSYEGGAFSLAFQESWPLDLDRLSEVRGPGRPGAARPHQERCGPSCRPLYRQRADQGLPWLNFRTDQRIAPYFYDWIKHDTWDDYWKQWTIRTRYNEVRVPALNFSGWYDVFMNGGDRELRRHARARVAREAARKGQKLVVGPWMHRPGS